MPLPPWALHAIAGLLLLFGTYRIAVALRARRRGDDADAPRGLFAMGWRRDLLFGVFYLVAGAYFVAVGFGYGVPTSEGAGDDVPLPAPPSEHLRVD